MQEGIFNVDAEWWFDQVFVMSEAYKEQINHTKRAHKRPDKL